MTQQGPWANPDLAGNIKAREQFEDALQYVELNAAQLPESARTRYWALWQERFAPPKVEPPKLVPMTDAESRAFEQTAMPFGVHVDKRVADVPISYLQYLITAPDKFAHFRRELERYCLSWRVRDETERDDEPDEDIIT